jgi:hypothetical protein
LSTKSISPQPFVILTRDRGPNQLLVQPKPQTLPPTTLLSSRGEKDCLFLVERDVHKHTNSLSLSSFFLSFFLPLVLDQTSVFHTISSSLDIISLVRSRYLRKNSRQGPQPASRTTQIPNPTTNPFAFLTRGEGLLVLRRERRAQTHELSFPPRSRPDQTRPISVFHTRDHLSLVKFGQVWTFRIKPQCGFFLLSFRSFGLCSQRYFPLSTQEKAATRPDH